MIRLIRLYQKFLSPITGGNCRFTPSCSHYSIEAYEKHGFFYATWLMIKRLFKCNPWGPMGYDPVPEPKHHHSAHQESCQSHNPTQFNE